MSDDARRAGFSSWPATKILIDLSIFTLVAFQFANRFALLQGGTMQRATINVLAWGVFAGIGGGVVSPASAAISLTLTSTPKPVVVQEGNPGAIKWTATNTSTSSINGDNLNIVIDVVLVSPGFPMVYVSGDREDEAFNPEIVNPDQYKTLVLTPQASFSFTEVFQSRDLGNTVEPDLGVWETSVRVEFHAAAFPSTPLSVLSDASRIHVLDPGAPEPAALAVFVSAVGVATRRARKPVACR